MKKKYMNITGRMITLSLGRNKYIEVHPGQILMEEEIAKAYSKYLVEIPEEKPSEEKTKRRRGRPRKNA